VKLAFDTRGFPRSLNVTIALLLGLGLIAALIWVLAAPLQVEAQPAASHVSAPAAPAADQTIRLVKDDDYFDAASVAITQVTSVFIDQDEAWSAYMSGELDTVAPPASEVISITDSAIYSDQIRTFAGSVTIWAAFSMDVPPTDSAQLRAALASAIDRQQLISDTGEHALPALTLTPPGQFGHVDGYAMNVGHPYSPTKAAAFLAASGYTGTPTITLMIHRSTLQPLADSLIDSWYSTLGVSATVEILPFQDMIQLLENGSASERPNVFRFGWASDYADAHNWHVDALTWSKQLMRYTGSPHDALAEAAAAATVTSTRQALYLEAEAQLVMTDTALIPLYYGARSRVTRNDLDRTYRSAGAQVISEWAFSGSARPLEIAWGAPATLDPGLVGDQVSFDYVEQLFVGLTGIDKDSGEARPELATGWEISDDATVFTFTLRTDVTWTDGVTVTAHDVEYGILRTLDPSTGAPAAYVLYAIENAEAYNTGAITDSAQVGVSALDDTHIRFTTADPAAFLPAVLAMPPAYPVPQWTIEAHGVRWTEAANIVTSGAYELAHRDLTPYLRIEKDADGPIVSGGELVFTIDYANRGGGDAEDTLIIDGMEGLTYLSDTAPFTHTGSGASGDPLIWHLHTLTGYVDGQFEVTVEVTSQLGERPENTVRIETSTPNDQGQPWEKEWYWSKDVELPFAFVNYSENRAGAAYPVGHTFWVTVTDSGGAFKASATGTTTPEGSEHDGAWHDGFYAQHSDWTSPELNIEALDWVYFLSDDGYTSTIRVGTITGTVDTEADTVEGEISVPWHSDPALNGVAGAWGFEWQSFTVDPGDGSYFVQFVEDLQPGWGVDVMYFEEDSDRVIKVIESLELVLEVNYGHDWVQSRYEAGHTGWVSVTESDGETVKATATFTTEAVPWWGGDTGFQTQWEDWDPSHPDIVPSDWVFAWISTGYTASVRIGDISGAIDLDGNSISGTVLATWLTETLDIHCSPYVEGAMWRDSSAEPDGSTAYYCQWDPGTEWEMEPGQDLAVSYPEPDGDRVTNVFMVPYPYEVFLPLVVRST